MATGPAIDDGFTNDKIARYRKLARSLAVLGDQHAEAITTSRYRLMYHYFIRCSGLTSAVILLVEAEHFAAAYALKKSLVDSLLNGLYIGYVAPDKEIERSIALALKGRCTGHSGMMKRARLLDEKFRELRPFITGLFEDLVKRTSEEMNEFGHGGLLSTVLEAKNQPAEVGYKAMADSVFVLIIFLSYVFLVEGLDLGPLEEAQREFAEFKTSST